ncbi:CopG family transcriptional regulator [SAR92 clade bacterium H455]|uniref:CopG family transcriptional regulator n=1 Tax=SAR92 clade bacterium H455 TaxID=2974818 RepID=A0ABY5TM52_9GAMM|nr:CopG family transcriptional regulator [SAR92 clade bacterium H455]
MSTLSKRSTVYFDPAIHQAVRIKAASSHLSVSEIVDEALRMQLAEDQEDLSAFDARVREPEISYESLLKDLKKHGKI